MTLHTDALIGQSKDGKRCDEIFVVDDDDCVRRILGAILSLEGFPVTCFDNGETFLEKASARVPICLFLDVVMPGYTGLQVLKELHARHYEAPVFLISARTDNAIVIEAQRNGGHAFLRKPFDPYSAVQRVRDAIDIWNFRDEWRESARLGTTDPSEQAGLTPLEAAEVLAQIVRGVSSKDIGKSLGIEKRAAEHFRISMMRKFGAKSTADLRRLVMS